MAYKVGSLADLISGTHDASSSNKNIVYIPTQRKNITPAIENSITPDHGSFSKKRPATETPIVSENSGKQRKLELSDVYAEEVEDEETTQNLSRRSRLKKRWPLNEEQEARTIFVKNVPYTADLKELKRKFEMYGTVETLRFRCAPQEDVRIPKKVSVIKKEFHPERTNICAFVRFYDIDSVAKAMKANGTLFNGYRIFVDKALKEQGRDQKKAIFLGNLPFGAEENDIWNIFEKCGKISDIRIVRDRETGLGKGFAFVNFQSADAVELAVSLQGVKLKDKVLRIFRATKKPTSKQRNGVNSNMRVQRKGNGKNDKGNDRSFKHKQLRDQNVENKAKKSERKRDKRLENKQSSIGSISKIKKVENTFQGQKMTDRKKKKKINKSELKKKIIAKKLTNSGKRDKSFKKQ